MPRGMKKPKEGDSREYILKYCKDRSEKIKKAFESMKRWERHIQESLDLLPEGDSVKENFMKGS